MRFKTTQYVNAVQYRGSLTPLRAFVDSFRDSVHFFDQGDWCVVSLLNYDTLSLFKMDWLCRDTHGNYEIISDAIFLLKYDPASDTEC